MRSLRRAAQGAVLLASLFLAGAWAAGAAVAATRFASVGGNPTGSDCTDPTAPCSLRRALLIAQRTDTLSLAFGRYDLSVVPPSRGPLHWTATDPAKLPILLTSSDRPTLSLTTAQSRSSFDHLVIGGPAATGSMQPAIHLDPGVAATVSSSTITGRRCVDAPAAGPLLIEDSTLSSTIAATCLELGSMSTVRRSTVTLPTNVIAPELPPPLMSTGGLVEDTSVDGGLNLTAPTAVARRVKARGIVAISGEGLVVDSLAIGAGTDGAAIAAQGLGNGPTLTVVNSTAINATGPALVSRVAGSLTAPTRPNDLVVTNSIARGRTTDIKADLVTACELGADCEPGQIEIDHSDFVTRDPAGPLVGRLQTLVLITAGAGNISGDPRFVNPAQGDYHLAAGSPAIDAGAPSDAALPADLDGISRVQGPAPDLGAFETTPEAVPPAPRPSAPGPPSPARPHPKPVISDLRVTPSTIRADKTRASRPRAAATIAFTLSEDAVVKLSFAKAEPGHLTGRRCVRSPRRARPCTRFVTLGSLTIRGRRGVNAKPFAGRLSRTSPLSPGTYVVTATPTNSAHAVGQARSVRLNVLAATRARRGR